MSLVRQYENTHVGIHYKIYSKSRQKNLRLELRLDVAEAGSRLYPKLSAIALIFGNLYMREKP